MCDVVVAPCVSIIIPCRNEERFIDNCIESVLHFAPIECGYEVLVIDGMSDDGTREKLGCWAARDDRIRLLDNPKRIVPAALNIGILEARGAWIVRLDAHSEYPVNYLRDCIRAAVSSGAENTGGVFITQHAGNTIAAHIVQALTTHRFGVGNATFRLDACPGPADTVPYGCFRREVFENIGLFDERLVRNQDYEFNRRLFTAGGKIWLDPAIEIYYYNQKDFFGLLRQAYLTGKWNPWTWYIAPYAFAFRHAIPALFICALIAALILGVTIDKHWLLMSAILVPYSVLALVATFQQTIRFGRLSLLLLPPFFLLYHLSYGCGICAGVLYLLLGRSPVQCNREPWPGAKRYRAWPQKSA